MNEPARNPEWSLIADLARRVPAHPAVPIGIGDDAALLKAEGSVLVTTDLLMDGVDFVVGQTPARLIGRKSLAVSLSDIAAMAGRPTGAVVSLAIPRQNGQDLIRGFYEGLLELAEQFDCPVIGGDTNSWDGPFVVNVTVLGEPTGGRAVTRAGAQPDDWMFVTGPLGGSLPSLRHCTFTPRIAEAQWLHRMVDVHAMLDLSDGLASDVHHLAESSGVGIVIDRNSVPIHGDVDPAGSPNERFAHALGDGEDFELAFCVSESDAQRLLNASPPGFSVFPIGRCTRSPGVWMDNNGVVTPLERGGWQHHFA